MLKNLEKYKILLASKSPRRRELLSELRIPFSCIALGGIDETYPADTPTRQIPEYLSRKKAEAYRENLTDTEMIITADTLVILGDQVLGKPRDLQQARQMLTQLSGQTHLVITGVTIMTTRKTVSFSSSTSVTFAPLSPEDIDYYVDTFHPTDKAGAYGIQEWIGCIAVESLQGSFYNVMGLPVHRLYSALKSF